MELHLLHAHSWERRTPDWVAAGVAGLAAGAVLMVMELFWPTFSGSSTPWATAHRVAAILIGPDALQTNGYSLGVVVAALFTHYFLGVAFGMLLSMVIAPMHLDSSNSMALVTGAVFGLLLYLVNFYVVERVFPWFAELRGWSTLVAHLVFGMTAAVLYRMLERHRSDQ
jgi:hypothetical protein